MRKLVAAAAAALALIGLAPIASQALAAPKARVAPDLAASLASAKPTDRLLVFVHGSTSSVANAGLRSAGLTKLGELQSIGVPVAVGTAAQVRSLTSKSGITFVEQDRALTPALETSRTAIRADEAITETFPEGGPFDGTGETIAIVDGGVDGTHPMFVDPATGTSKVVRNLKVACFNNVPGLTFEASLGQDPKTCPGSYTGNGEDNEPFILDMTAVNDTDTVAAGGHGTHVAGIAGGVAVTTTDGHHLSGIAPGARIVGVTMGASLTIYGADAALDWVARHHDDPCGDGSCPPITVVNNSYGNGGANDPESATSLIQQRLIAAGVTMVWANGNGDVTGDGGNGSDNRSGSDAQLQVPGVIAVANYDDAGTGTRDGALDPSSSRGMRGALETYPDISAPGANITSACRPYLTICDGALNADPNYGTISGTSMAAPHVTGAIAVLQQAALVKLGRHLTPAEVEDLLEDTAHKLDFGGAYESDPTNAGETTSFDKGHGLMDVTRALETIMAAPFSTPPTSACPSGTPLVTDPAGDATAVALADGGDDAYEAGLDVTSVAVTGDAVAETLSVVFHVVDLGEMDPALSTGSSFEGSLSIGPDSYAVGADRSAGAETFTFGGDDVSGAFDPAADTVTVVIPRALLGGAAGDVTVKGLSAGFSRRDLAALGPVSDSFAGACATTVAVGGEPAPEDPPVEPAGADGEIASGESYSWGNADAPASVVSEPSGQLDASVTVEGERETTKVVTVHAVEGSTLTFAISCANPADDYDLHLTGPTGAPAGAGVDVVTGDPQPGASTNPGCGESITVTNATPGDYTALVTAFTTVHSTYEASLSLS
jgi:serine protease AprX